MKRVVPVRAHREDQSSKSSRPVCAECHIAVEARLLSFRSQPHQRWHLKRAAQVCCGLVPGLQNTGRSADHQVLDVSRAATGPSLPNFLWGGGPHSTAASKGGRGVGGVAALHSDSGTQVRRAKGRAMVGGLRPLELSAQRMGGEQPRLVLGSAASPALYWSISEDVGCITR